MTKPLRAVLFDIGGTLWSSPPEDPEALLRCYTRGRDALVPVCDPLPALEALIEGVEGHFADWEERWRLDRTLVEQGPTEGFVAEALGRLGVRPTLPAIAAFTSAILETSLYTAKTLQPEDGMPEALAALKDRGLSLAAVSNAFMGAGVLQSILDERGLGRYCDLTVSSCEVGYRKPHPRIYEEALRILAVRPEQCVFVGDRIDADVEGPAALGMRTVLTHQYRQEDLGSARVQPDFVISHLRELPDVIDRLARGG